MDMKKIVVITSEFASNKINHENKSLEKNWIFDEMYIFMRFTVQCLINQSDNNFIALYVYEDLIEEDILKALDKYSKLPSNIRFVKKSEYIENLDKITRGYDILILSKSNSDNLYSDDFVETLMKYEIRDTIEEILFRNGYIYDVRNNRLAEYYNRKSNLYTFIYRLSKGNNKYMSLDISPIELLTGFSEFRIIDYKYEVLNQRNFMVMIHGNKKSFSDYNNGFNRVERFIDDKEEIEEILYGFL